MSVSQYVPPPSVVAHNQFDTRTPLQQVFYWTPEQWEQFTCEWVRMCRDEFGYLGVEVLGGTNDRGADVVAFMSEQRLNGVWHCYQCKHYTDDLALDDALPEMIKPFVATLETSRTLPARYIFVAPKIHPRLKDMVLTPAALKDRFLTYLDGRTKPVAALSPQTWAAVRALAESTDFSMFWTVNLDEVLEVYSKSPLFASRFNLPPTGKPRKLLPLPSPRSTKRATSSSSWTFTRRGSARTSLPCSTPSSTPIRASILGGSEWRSSTRRPYACMHERASRGTPTRSYRMTC